jgi:hypothetical protein
VDLYFLIKEKFALQDCFRFFEMKFHGMGFDPYHRLRSLTYFDQAEQEPMPDMLLPFDWAEAKSFFNQQIRMVWGKTLT